MIMAMPTRTMVLLSLRLQASPSSRKNLFSSYLFKQSQSCGSTALSIFCARPSSSHKNSPSQLNTNTAHQSQGSSPQVQPRSSTVVNKYEPTLMPNTAEFSVSSQPTSNSAVFQDIPDFTPTNLLEHENIMCDEQNLKVKKGDRLALFNQVDPRTVHKVYYFNSLAMTKRLENKGFTREQAESCVECLLDVIGSTLEHQAKHMITKTEQKIGEQQLQTEIMSVKKDMVLLQKSEFSTLRTETEKISIDIARIQSHFEDEVVKLKGQFTLDVNLERGRAVEAHAASEKSIQMLDNKIETEIAHLKTTYEVYRNDIFKYAAGTVLTCTTLIIGFIRLWS